MDGERSDIGIFSRIRPVAGFEAANDQSILLKQEDVLARSRLQARVDAVVAIKLQRPFNFHRFVGTWRDGCANDSAFGRILGIHEPVGTRVGHATEERDQVGIIVIIVVLLTIAFVNGQRAMAHLGFDLRNVVPDFDLELAVKNDDVVVEVRNLDDRAEVDSADVEVAR